MIFLTEYTQLLKSRQSLLSLIQRCGFGFLPGCGCGCGWWWVCPVEKIKGEREISLCPLFFILKLIDLTVFHCLIGFKVENLRYKVVWYHLRVEICPQMPTMVRRRLDTVGLEMGTEPSIPNHWIETNELLDLERQFVSIQFELFY